MITYSSRYEDEEIRGEEEQRPWDLVEIVRGWCTPATVLLDVGCGTCRKVLPLAPLVKEVYGLEPSESMRAKAHQSVAAAGLPNVSIVSGVAESLPFPDGTFDIVTCMVAPHHTREVHRVLKPGGRAILEKIGERDKANVKEFFGSDDRGPRGQFLEFQEGERQAAFAKEFQELFPKVEVRSGKWKTHLSRDGLVLLFKETNSVRNFDPEKDAHCIERAVEKYSTAKGIETVQHRILIMAWK